jgi:hypothetical protein
MNISRGWRVLPRITAGIGPGGSPQGSPCDRSRSQHGSDLGFSRLEGLKPPARCLVLQPEIVIFG